jgi:hypothetical protein
MEAITQRLNADPTFRKEYLHNAKNAGDKPICWVLNASLVMMNKSGIITGPVLEAYLGLDEQGGFLYQPAMGLWGAKYSPMPPSMMAETLGTLLMPALMTLCFMNCKNVKVIRNEPAPLSEKEIRQGKEPRLRFHTLDIEPMRTVLRTEGHSETEGVPRALHICRGHFANYTERPLFGKHYGRFWVPMHVRGKLEAGEIKKGYNVRS